MSALTNSGWPISRAYRVKAIWVISKISSTSASVDVYKRQGLGGGQERTQKEVADMMGISQSYISRLEKRIIKQLHEDLSKMA